MPSEDIEKRLKIMEDIEAIKRLHYRYINSLSFTLWDDVVDCFARDGAVDLGEGSAESTVIRGKAALSKFFRNEISRSHIGQEGIFVIHPKIDVDGDTATGEWLSFFMHIRSRGKEPLLNWMQGMYNCKYVRENNEWKFSLLKWTARLKYGGPQMQVLG